MTIRPWPQGSSSTSIAVLMLAVSVAYIERTAISHAMPFIFAETSFSKSEAGWILSSFGFGYVVSLPLSGWIIRKLGYSRTLRWLSLGWLVAAVGLSNATDYRWMVIVRFALGLFEGPLFPLFVSWISMTNRTESRPMAIGTIEACSYLGMALAGPIMVSIGQVAGWRLGYTILGGIALIVWLASYLLVEPTRPLEEAVLSEGVTAGKRFFSVSCSILFIAAGFLLYNTAKSFYSTWFPTVLVQDFHFTSIDAAKVTFIQSMAAPAASLLAAAVSVSLLRSGLPLTFSRCLPLTAGLTVGASIVMSQWLPGSAAVISVLAFVGLISTSALIWNSVPDNVEPTQAGTTAGWVNAIANIGSIVSPIVVGQMMESSRNYVLTFVAVVCVLAIPMFVLAYVSTATSLVAK